MSDSGNPEPSVVERAIASLAEGGLPQIIAGPAGKALSRLIGSAADIPAAWLEQRAQAIRDETAARSGAMKDLGKAVGQSASADEGLISRAKDRLLGKAYREQSNREAVASATIDLLQEDPPPEGSSGPDEDWLNMFGTYAEQASSDRLRSTWARILAGEIRSSGTYSLATLQFVSVLDTKKAEIARRLFSLAVADQYIILEGEQYNKGGFLFDVAEFAALGLLVEDKSWWHNFNARGFCAIEYQEKVLVIFGPPGDRVNLHVAVLTQVGREIASIAKVPVDGSTLLEIGKAIQSSHQEVSGSCIGAVTSRSGNSFSYEFEHPRDPSLRATGGLA